MQKYLMRKWGELMRINREKLAVAMVRREWNVNQLAASAGISRCTVSAVKGGKSCSRKTAEKLAHALGEDVAELIQGAK